MKSHEFARALRQMADLLVAGPNAQMKDLKTAAAGDVTSSTTREIAVNLSTLVSLSRLDKRQWLAVVTEYGLPIKINPRDSSRDLVGKVLRYLESHPEAQERLSRTANSTSGQASPELLRALQSLLRN
jgi:hypothetical protein